MNKVSLFRFMSCPLGGFYRFISKHRIQMSWNIHYWTPISFSNFLPAPQMLIVDLAKPSKNAHIFKMWIWQNQHFRSVYFDLFPKKSNASLENSMYQVKYTGKTQNWLGISVQLFIIIICRHMLSEVTMLPSVFLLEAEHIWIITAASLHMPPWMSWPPMPCENLLSKMSSNSSLTLNRDRK